MPRSISALPPALCRDLTYLFTDIDDTLTTEGLLPEESYAAIWALHRAGVQVVPVTGRPAGWCDHIARMWPVAGIIGENGAFYFVYDREARRMRREYAQSPQVRQQEQEGLKKIRDQVLAQVPGAAIASDQAYRIADLAVDFREDVPPLDQAAVDRICRIGEEHGAVCKVSSIHVNCWYGDYDKISCLRDFLLREGGGSLEEMQERIIFAGDSPNDEPAFREFRHSIGVANIRDFLDRLEHPPRYVTEGRGGEGFAEAVSTILRQRSERN